MHSVSAILNYNNRDLHFSVLPHRIHAYYTYHYIVTGLPTFAWIFCIRSILNIDPNWSGTDLEREHKAPAPHCAIRHYDAQ